MTRTTTARTPALDPDRFHRELAASHIVRLSPSTHVDDWERLVAIEVAIRRREREFVEAERAAIAGIVRNVPTNPNGFIEWFEALARTGPGQGDPLFPWLAHTATDRQMRWFLSQELAGEAGFDDLVALTQVKLPPVPKLELARNYWDEMGQGHQGGMHGPMLADLARALALEPLESVAWESLALGNLMVALATARHYAYQSIGALGVIELTAPGRAELVNEGLRRLGVGGAARKYYALHATLDGRHSQTWNREVILPLIQDNPAVAVAIAEGALLRLRAGAACFARYRAELWNDDAVPPSGARLIERDTGAPRAEPALRRVDHLA